MAKLIIHPNTPTISEVTTLIDFSDFVAHLDHPDVKILGMQNSSSIGIQEVRDFIQWVGMRPFQESSKLGVIFNAHKLTEQAQNALLKTLEEHNSATHLVIVTNSPHQLLPTVLSRLTKHQAPSGAGLATDTSADTAQFLSFLRGDYWSRGEQLSDISKNSDRAELAVFIFGLQRALVARAREGIATGSLADELEAVAASNAANVNFKLIIQYLQNISQLL